jgi:hypothetical protein
MRSHSAEPTRRSNSYSNIFDKLYNQTTLLQSKRNVLNNKVREEYVDKVNKTKFTNSIGHKPYSPSNFVRSSLHARSTSPSPFSRRNSLLKEEHNDGILNRQPNRRASSTGRIRDKNNYIFSKRNNIDESKTSSNNTSKGSNNGTIHDRLYSYAFEKKHIQEQKNYDINKERDEWIEKNKFENSIGHLPYSPHHNINIVGKDHNMLYNHFHRNKEVKRRASIKVSVELQSKIEKTSFKNNSFGGHMNSSPSKSMISPVTKMNNGNNFGEKLYLYGEKFRQRVDSETDKLRESIKKEKSEKEIKEINRVYYCEKIDNEGQIKKGQRIYAETKIYKDFPLHSPRLHTSPLKQRRAFVTTDDIYHNQYEYSNKYKEKMETRKKNIENAYNKVNNHGIPVIAKKSHSIAKSYREERSDLNDNGNISSRSRCFSPSARSRDHSRDRSINRSISREKISNNNSNSRPILDDTNNNETMNRLTVDSTSTTTKDSTATSYDVGDNTKIELIASIDNTIVSSNNAVATTDTNTDSKSHGSNHRGRRLYPNSSSAPTTTKSHFNSSVSQPTFSSKIRQYETTDIRKESKVLIGKVDALSLELSEIMSSSTDNKNENKSNIKGKKSPDVSQAEVSISPIHPQAIRPNMTSPSNTVEKVDINSSTTDDNHLSPFQLPMTSPIMIPLSPGSFSYETHRNNVTSLSKSHKSSNNMTYSTFSPLGKSISPSPISNNSNISSATTRSSVSLYDQLYDDRLRNVECMNNAIKKHNIEPSFKPDIGVNNIKVEENREVFYKRLHDHKAIQEQEIIELRSSLYYERMRQELSPANGSISIKSQPPINSINKDKNSDNNITTNGVTSTTMASPKAKSIVSSENVNKSKLSSTLASEIVCSEKHIKEVLHRLTVVESNRMKDEVINKRLKINKEIYDKSHINQTLNKSSNMVHKIRNRAISEIYNILVQTVGYGKEGKEETSESNEGNDINASINSSIVMDGDSLNGSYFQSNEASIDNIKENNDTNSSHILLDTTLAASNLIQPKNLSTFVDILLSRCQPPNHLLTKEDFISKFEQLILTGDAPPVNSLLCPNNNRKDRLEKVEHGYNNGLTTEEREIKFCTWNPIIPNKSIKIAINNKKSRNQDQSHGEFLWSYEDKRQTRLEVKRKELDQKDQKECTFQPYLYTKSTSYNTTAKQ